MNKDDRKKKRGTEKMNGKDPSKQVVFWVQFGLVQVKENVKDVDGFVFLVGEDASLNKGDREKESNRCCGINGQQETSKQVALFSLFRG